MAETMLVTSCCNKHYSLRRGTIFIGIFHIICSILILIMVVGLNAKWNEPLNDFDPYVTKIVYAVASSLTIFMSILLLVGVFKRNTCMMLPWLVLGVIALVGGIISTIGTTIIYSMKQETTSAVAGFVLGCVHLVIGTCLWVVVYRHFQELQNDRTNSRIHLCEEP